MSTAVFRVENPSDFTIAFNEARQSAIDSGASELRVEIPAGTYDGGPRTLSLRLTPLRKLTVVGVGGPVVYRKAHIAFEAPSVAIQDLVFEGGQESDYTVMITAAHHIEVDGLAVIGKRHARSVGPARGGIWLRSNTDAATASIRRLWLIDNVSSTGSGITIYGDQGHRFANVEIADAVFAHNHTMHGISAELVDQLNLARIVVLEPLLRYGWLELVHETVRTSIGDSVIAAAHGLLSYRDGPDSKRANFAKPVLRKVSLRSDRKGELVDTPDNDVTYDRPITIADWSAIATTARGLAVPDRDSLVPQGTP